MGTFFTFTKKHLPIYILLLSLFLVAMTADTVLLVLAKRKLYIYFNNGTQTEFIHTIACSIIIAAVGLFFAVVIKHKLLKVISIVLCTGILLAFVGVSTFFDTDKTIFEFHSPDSSHVIIVEEWAWLMGGEADVYQKTGGCFVTRLDELITDDGYRPFSKKDYSIEWSGKTVHIEYGFGNSARKTEEFHLK